MVNTIGTLRMSSSWLMYSTILQQPAEIGRQVIRIAEMIRTGKKDQVESLYTIPIVDVRQNNAAKWMPAK